MSLEEIDLRIAQLEKELAKLRRIGRAKLGGQALAGRPRKRKFSDEAIWSAYDDEYAKSFFGFGAVKRTAERLGIATKTV